MQPKWTRRQFVRAGAVASVAVAARPSAGQDPVQGFAIVRPDRVVVIASANGNTVTNGGPRTCVQDVFERLTAGEDVVAAVVSGVRIVELDPADDSVGYGGLPNADGVVQLDAAVMHGPRRAAGAVACLEGVRTPAEVARTVMDTTDHHLLVGKGAQEFARRMGFAIEDDLNTAHSRGRWLEWKRRSDPEHWPDRTPRAAVPDRARASMLADGLLDANRVHGTIHCAARGRAGDLGAATTTSGLAFKIPGRVGDSPILGAGLWVDNAVGTAGSTGRGEANLFGLGSFVIVEEMRRGTNPKDACLEALRRIRAATVEPRLLNSRGTPRFQVSFYAMNVRGEHAAVALYGGTSPKYAVCDASGPRTIAMEALLPGTPLDDPPPPSPSR